ncbi:MAG: amidohydrolase family protein [Patescibacteria group bacterium]|jgi:N-acyl-D-amino-acid deacylase|nr:amidohydrolase family protein [Patescibacteria group bacterium]
MTILIKNGTIINGSGKEPFKGDILIKDKKIIDISFNKSINKKAEKIIDASNLIITPGFIDINNESDHWLTLLTQKELESLIAQGITSIIVGNNGSSLAPVFKNSLKSIRKWSSLNVNLNWTSVEEFLKTLEKQKISLNIGTLVGHATIKRGILEEEFRDLIDSEIKQMLYLIEKSLDEGALGVSMGLRFNHSRLTSFSEIFSISEIVRKHDAILNIQPRWEKHDILSFINEIHNLVKTITNAEQLKILISYLRPYKENIDELKLSLGLLEKIRGQYCPNIHLDVNPYTLVSNQMYLYLPEWLLFGNFEMMVRVLSEKNNYQRILSELKEKNYDYGKMIISSAQNNIFYFNGKSIKFLAKERGVTPEEMFLEIFKISNGRAMILYDEILWPELLGLMELPYTIITSQNAGLNFSNFSFLPHIASINTFPRFIGLVKSGVINISLSEAIKKITFEPALKIGIKNRGLITKDYFADLVIIDLKEIDYAVDYKNPTQKPRGIKTVLINGQIVFENDQFTNNTAGQILTR